MSAKENTQYRVRLDRLHVHIRADVTDAIVFNLLREAVEKLRGVRDPFVDGLEEDRLHLRDPASLLAETEFKMRRGHALESQWRVGRGEQ